MLVILSDLHFIDETAGPHSVPSGVFRRIFHDGVFPLARSVNASELVVLLLGDIVDLLRTEQWFDGNIEDRPWGANGMADVPVPRPNSATEARCRSILGTWQGPATRPPHAQTILSRNWETFQFFRGLPHLVREALGEHAGTRVIYTPGNHDRLCNLYPWARDWVRDVLGVSVDPADIVRPPGGEWWFKYDYASTDYHVYCRHGHQFDLWNYAGGDEHDRASHLRVPVGDVFTTEFAVRIPWLSEKEPILRGDPALHLRDIDNVRPLSAVLEWVTYQAMRIDDSEVRDALRRVVRTMLWDLLDVGYLRTWRSTAELPSFLLRLVSRPSLKWLRKMAIWSPLCVETVLPVIMRQLGGSSDPNKDPLAIAANVEPTLREGGDIRYIVYGHTHDPLTSPLSRHPGREPLYANSGTWRERIVRSIGPAANAEFMKLRQFTYSVFYKDTEISARGLRRARTFEMWTGTENE